MPVARRDPNAKKPRGGGLSVLRPAGAATGGAGGWASRITTIASRPKQLFGSPRPCGRESPHSREGSSGRVGRQSGETTPGQFNARGRSPQGPNENRDPLSRQASP